MIDAIDLTEMVSEPTDVAATIAQIFARDAAFYEVIRKHGIKPVVFVGFDDAPTDTRDEARKRSDTALLAAIGRTQRR